MQLTHPARINNDIARLLCCSFKVALDSRQFVGLWRLDLVQDTINHDICCLSFVIVTNGNKLNDKSMLGKSMSGLQLVIPWRNTSWNNNFSGLMRHCIHSNKEQGNKAKGFENKTNASKFEAFSYLLLSLAGSTSRVGNPLLMDFILIAQRLEKLGFIYSRGAVLVLEGFGDEAGK